MFPFSRFLLPTCCPLQVLAGYHGLTIAVSKDSVAEQCMALLGHALSTDQLCWIALLYNAKHLMAVGSWDALSVPFPDDDDSTHLWSEELHENCTDD